MTDEAPGQPWQGPRDAGRRRRGRRGRGGRPPIPGQPFRPAGVEEDESSAQAREVGAYERRQRQPQRGPGAGGFKPGGWRPPVPARAVGQRQRYQDMVRRATAGTPTGPAQEPGEPIAGPHAVLEALRSGRVVRRVYIAQERGVRTGATNDVVREAQERRVPLRFVDRMEIQRLSPGVEHQGVVAIAESRPGVELDELLLHLDTLSEPPLVLVIDSLQDPQNFGVLLRSGEAAGVEGVVIPRHRQVGLTPAVARTSAGASEHLLIADVANLRQAIDALKEKGVWVVGTDESGDAEWDEVDYRGATAIVIGGEGEGIRRLVLEGCDQVVRIPMQGKVPSLNAAAAGSVVLFEALRQRLRDTAPAQGSLEARVPHRPKVAEAVAEEAGDPADASATEPAPSAASEPQAVSDPEAAASEAGHDDHHGIEELSATAEEPQEAATHAAARDEEPSPEASDAAAPKPKRVTKATAAKRAPTKRAARKPAAE